VIAGQWALVTYNYCNLQRFPLRQNLENDHLRGGKVWTMLVWFPCCLSIRLDFIKCVITDASEKILTWHLQMAETRRSNMWRWCWYRLICWVRTTACRRTWCCRRLFLLSLLLCFQSCWERHAHISHFKKIKFFHWSAFDNTAVSTFTI